MKNKKGFTLVELLIVILITITLIGAAISSLINTRRSFIFNGASQKLEIMLRTARSYAVTGKATKDYSDFDNDGDKTDLVSPANYGIFLDKSNNEIILFADIHDTTEGKYDAPASGNHSAGTDEILDKYTIPSNLELSFNAKTGNTVSILYTPIFADTTFNNVPDTEKTLFHFGIKEKTGTSPLKRCFKTNIVSGTIESADHSEC